MESTAHVLVVDDEPNVRLAVAELVELRGFTASAVANADEALQVLENEAVDVVFADIVLPGIDGVALLERIRDRHPDVLVVMITGVPTVETATAAVRAGAFDYLVKPFTAEVISRVLGNAVRVKELRDAKHILEAQNRRYREQLEDLVTERTRELGETNHQLREALDELQETQSQIIQQERLRALGQMASGIAHEINNSLGIVLGFTEILLNVPGKLDDRDRVQRYLSMIHTAAKDGAEVVRRMREFYRQRKTDDLFGPLDLNQLVEETVSLTEPRWRNQAQGAGTSVRIETDFGSIPLVEGNGAQLREVLTNLIINAVDAIEREGRVTIRTHSAGEQVIVTVSDTGRGMNEDTRTRCFDPFFSTKGEDGTGLGLSLVQGIIGRHDGSVDVESTPKQGTTFTLRFPAYRCEQSDCRPSVADAPADRRRLRLLAIEDDAVQRQLLTEILVTDGHTVDTAADGAEGLVAARKTTYDLIITGQAMPGMNGEQIAARLKATNPELPIVLLTGFENGSAQSARPGGIDAIVSKPLDRAALQATIAALAP